MGELIKIGPYDIFPSSRGGGGYSDRRRVSVVDKELIDNGSSIICKDIASNLVARFPSDSPLRILEGGSGYGHILSDFGDNVRNLGRIAETTGVTKEEIHEPAAAYVDRLIIGSLQRAFRARLLPKSSFHLVLDIRGAATYGSLTSVTEIYSKLLKNEGLLFLWKSQLDMPPHLFSAAAQEQETLQTLKQNGFDLIEKAGTYALLEKSRNPRKS